MTTIFETERLRARLFTESDAPLLRALNENPNVYRYTGDGPLADDAAALEILRTRIFPQVRLHGTSRFAVELLPHVVIDPRPAHTCIGWCGLKLDPDDGGAYDLGYRFFEDAWGHGFATEAARATLAWARVNLKDARIIARARVENVASHRVLEKIGMTRGERILDLDGEVDIYRL
jgi:ribosomal-protein-alanine N-acetyltransferase